MDCAPIAQATSRLPPVFEGLCWANRKAAFVDLVYACSARFSDAPRYYEPSNSGCGSGALTLGTALVLISNNLYFHISNQKLVHPWTVSSAICSHGSRDRDRAISGKRDAYG